MEIDPEREITDEEWRNAPVTNTFEDYPIGTIVTVRHDEVKLDYPNLDMNHTLLDQGLWSTADRWNPDPRVEPLIVLTAKTNLDERIDSIEPIHKDGVAAVAYSNTGAFVCDITSEELDRLYWATEETLAELKEFALQYKKWVPVTFLNQTWAGITVALPEIIGKSQTYDPHLREHLYQDGHIVIQITEKGPRHKYIKGLETFAAQGDLPTFIASKYPEIVMRRAARLEFTQDFPPQVNVESKPFLSSDAAETDLQPSMYVHISDTYGDYDKTCTMYQFIPIEKHTRNTQSAAGYTTMIIVRSVIKDDSNSSLDVLFNFYRGSEVLKSYSMEIVEVSDESWDSFRYQWLETLNEFYAIANGFDFVVDDDKKVDANPDLSSFG